MRTVERILAISDIHGANKKLLNLLDKAEYNPVTDLLILVGDMIDRGEDNLDTIAICEELRSKGAILLKGNHLFGGRLAAIELPTCREFYV